MDVVIKREIDDLVGSGSNFYDYSIIMNLYLYLLRGKREVQEYFLHSLNKEQFAYIIVRTIDLYEGINIFKRYESIRVMVNILELETSHYSNKKIQNLTMIVRTYNSREFIGYIYMDGLTYVIFKLVTRKLLQRSDNEEFAELFLVYCTSDTLHDFITSYLDEHLREKYMKDRLQYKLEGRFDIPEGYTPLLNI